MNDTRRGLRHESRPKVQLRNSAAAERPCRRRRRPDLFRTLAALLGGIGQRWAATRWAQEGGERRQKRRRHLASSRYPRRQVQVDGDFDSAKSRQKKADSGKKLGDKEGKRERATREASRILSLLPTHLPTRTQHTHNGQERTREFAQEQ